MNKILTTFGLKKQPKRVTEKDMKRIVFEKNARKQFIQLKQKGLGIRIIVL